MPGSLRLPQLSPIEMMKRSLTLTTHRIHQLPVLVLMAHSRCNCRCVMCDIWKANRSGSEISRELLAEHAAEMRKIGVRWVVLSGGEALMHSNLWALCELVRGLPAKITLLSTGLLLKRHAADIVRWCDEVTVSLDGSREVHDRIRRIPRAFDRLAEGVAALKEQNRSFPVTTRCVIQRQNYADLPRIIDAAREIGLDRISFLAVDVSSSAFNRPTPWGDERIDEVALSPNEVEHFRQVVESTIESNARDFSHGFVAESPDKLRRLPAYFAALNGQGQFPAVDCNAPWVSAVIETDGAVRPCFFHAPFGNISERPLLEILNSDAAVDFRRRLDVARDPICQKCVCTLRLGLTTPVGPRFG